MDMGESALCGEEESRCVSSEATGGSSSNVDSFGVQTVQTRRELVNLLRIKEKLHTSRSDASNCQQVDHSGDVGILGTNATSFSVVGSRQVPAAPLLYDPLPVLDHFFGQTDYPAQGAAGGEEREESQTPSLDYPPPP